MRLTFTTALLPVLCLSHSVSAYFAVTNPTTGTEWVNGKVATVTWEKGIDDNVDLIDLELSRLGADGLILAAKNVQTRPGGINILLENVPPADDYIVICINSTHGISHGVSKPFSILASNASPNTTSSLKPIDKAPTVTVTSGPNPTAFFQTTLPALPGGAVSFHQLWRADGGFAGTLVVGAVGFVGAALLLL